MASQLSDRHFYETLYECHCFGFIVSDEQGECKSKFTIDNTFNSINNPLRRIIQLVQAIFHPFKEFLSFVIMHRFLVNEQYEQNNPVKHIY